MAKTKSQAGIDFKKFTKILVKAKHITFLNRGNTKPNNLKQA
jgi:hypothetical protein